MGFSGIADVALLIRLGKNIRTARKNRKLSRNRLAELAGVGLSTLARLERGDSGVSIGSLLAVLAIMRLDNQKSFRIAEPEDDPLHIEKMTMNTKQELDKLLEFDDD
jgi:transcriptional regulator with XRE-family HTH domain